MSGGHEEGDPRVHPASGGGLRPVPCRALGPSVPSTRFAATSRTRTSARTRRRDAGSRARAGRW
jgi:hypothetical protein